MYVKFLGCSIPSKLRKWISENTSTNKPPKKFIVSKGHYPYTTTRDSVKTAEAWRSHLTYDIAKSIDAVCSEAMKELGYSRVSDKVMYHNMSHSLVLDLPVPQAISLHLWQWYDLFVMLEYTL